jgi:FMN phosphatase YigB (HAD superfamily)
MTTLNNQNVVVFDCDNTLLMWDKQHDKPGPGKIEIKDPYDSNVTLYLTPHQVHIRLLRQYKGRGFTVIVWTKAGALWAEQTVKVLGLEGYVDFAMTKPDKYVDDALKIEDIIGNRIYFEDKE